MMRRLVAALAILLSVFCFASGASAHASLVSAEPSDGSVLAAAPKTVQLRFNEAVTPAVISLIDAMGRTRDDASVHSDGDTIVIALPDDLPRGTQVVSYRVISEDGHPVAGSLVFSIGAATAPTATPTNAGSINGLIWLARIGIYLGLLMGVGGAFFAAWIEPARAGSRATVAALVVGLFSALASLGLQGLDLLNLSLADIATPAPWKAAAATSLAPSLLIAISAMAVSIIVRRNASARIARILSAFALAGVGVSLAASGHAATAPPQWLTRPAVFLHGVGVAFWVGALMPLAAMAWTSADGLLPVLNRFSRGSGAGRRRAAADRAYARDHPAWEFSRSDRDQIRADTVDQNRARHRAARPRGAEPLSPHPKACCRSRRYPAAGSIDPA
jgi:copper transport protein